MKNLLFIFSIFAFIGCTTTEPEESVADTEKSVEEINAERGDPCDCTNESLLAMDLFLNKINADAFETSVELNAELALTMRDCMQPIGHKVADIAWNASMQGCESFSIIREAMITVKNKAAELKASEQTVFINATSTEGANGVLKRLQEEAK
jgi:hypothetical protein|tara:strand:- start:605 stop:1060 length:456 start_codon:yes stop_codon:yes gene_type:complete